MKTKIFIITGMIFALWSGEGLLGMFGNDEYEQLPGSENYGSDDESDGEGSFSGKEIPLQALAPKMCSKKWSFDALFKAIETLNEHDIITQLQLLEQQGFDLNDPINKQQQRIIHYVTAFGFKAVLIWLLQKNVMLTVGDREQCTPYHYLWNNVLPSIPSLSRSISLPRAAYVSLLPAMGVEVLPWGMKEKRVLWELREEIERLLLEAAKATQCLQVLLAIRDRQRMTAEVYKHTMRQRHSS